MPNRVSLDILTTHKGNPLAQQLTAYINSMMYFGDYLCLILNYEDYVEGDGEKIIIRIYSMKKNLV